MDVAEARTQAGRLLIAFSLFFRVASFTVAMATSAATGQGTVPSLQPR